MANQAGIKVIRWIGIFGTFFVSVPLLGFISSRQFGSDAFWICIVLLAIFAWLWRRAGQKISQGLSFWVSPSHTENMLGMKDSVRVFFAMGATIAGILLLANLNLLRGDQIWWEWSTQSHIDRFGKYVEDASVRTTDWGHVMQAVVGVLLLAGGLSHFWQRSRFYKR
jgi:hypothetical protein